MKKHFTDLFNIVNGAISPKFPVSIGGATMSPGVSFGGGASFGGVNLAQHTNSYFDTEVQGGVYIIKGIYN